MIRTTSPGSTTAELLERLRDVARFQGQPIRFGARWIDYLETFTLDELLDLKLAGRAARAG